MTEETEYADYKVITDFDKECSSLYDKNGEHIFTSEEWCFTRWCRENELFEHGYAFMRSFSTHPHRTTIYSIEKGIIFIEGVRIINSMPWNDLLWVWRYDDKNGLLNFDLEWALPPIYDSIEAPDRANSMPFISCRKDNKEYIYTMQGRLYPTSDDGEAEVILVDDHMEKAPYRYLNVLVIKECYKGGKWRYVYMEELENGSFFNYESQYIYDDIEKTDDCEYVTCIESGKRTEIMLPVYKE